MEDPTARTSLPWQTYMARELLLAERGKATLLAGFTGAMALLVSTYFQANRADYLRLGVDAHILFIVPLVFVLFCAFELWHRRELGRALESGARRSGASAWVAAALEVSVPTTLLFAACSFTDPAQALNAPPLMLYGVFITLTALRLDPWLCVFSGAVAGLGYLGLYHGMQAEVEASRFAGAFSSSNLSFFGRSFLIFLIGVGAAFVAWEVRKRMERALQLQEQRNWVVGVFGRYVTDEVVEVLLNSPDGLKMGGEKRRVTIMMTDLRGFSSLSSRLAPEAVMAMLNHYLGAMTDVVVEYGGTIDEFIGDAILVIFGAPVDRPDHADRAVACALAMQREMEAVNRWNHSRGFPLLEMGVGINTGEVVVGNIGSEKRGKFGVVGTEVNMAARIESCTVGGQVLVSESTLAALEGPVETAGTLEVQPKGSPHPVVLHDVVALGDLRRPTSEGPMVRLPAPVPVQLRVLESKQPKGPVLSGSMAELSAQEAVLHGVSAPDRTELTFALEGGDEAFVRVLAPVEGGVKVRFTWRGPATQARLAALLPEAEDSVLA